MIRPFPFDCMTNHDIQELLNTAGDVMAKIMRDTDPDSRLVDTQTIMSWKDRSNIPIGGFRELPPTANV